MRQALKKQLMDVAGARPSTDSSTALPARSAHEDVFTTPAATTRPGRLQRRPDFFIIGAPKSGTTAMTHYLSSHPEIFMARKEMHLFGADLEFGARLPRCDQETYLTEFEQANGARSAGEASVWYLYSKQAAAEIKAFNPQARILIMLREPAEMIYSLYYQFLFDANEHLPTFREALAAEEQRRAGRGARRTAYFLKGLVYRETARYAEQVRRYFELFGREQVKVIIYDDFSANPVLAWRETLEFLGVTPRGLDQQFRIVNPNKYVRSRLLQRVMADPWLRSSCVGTRRWLPRKVFGALRRAEAALWHCNARVAKRPPLEPDLRARLKADFAFDNDQLGRLLGRDLTHWSK